MKHDTGAQQALAGKRALIVEDEALVAMLLEDMLTDLGCQVATAARVDTAFVALDQGPVDFAILDLNVGGQNTYPLADVLADRGIPFLFATGYGSSGLAEAYRACVTLQKPFEMGTLIDAIGAVLADRERAG